MRTTARLWLVVLMIGCAGLTGGPSVAAAANIPSWTWGAPSPVGPATGFTALSCPSARLCVASAGSAIAASGDPTSNRPAWHRTDLSYDLSDLTCPDDHLCLGLTAVAGVTNQVAVTTDPTGPASAWRVTSLPVGDTEGTTRLACPSRQLCVIAGYGSGSHPLLLTSTAPATGPWTRTTLRPPPCTPSSCAQSGSFLRDVACPTSRLCVASDSNGNVFVSTRPAAGAGAWSARYANLPGFGGLSDLSCPSVSMCVATADRQLQVSTDPSGGGASWRPAETSFAVNWLDCPMTDYCLAAPPDAFPYAAASPAGSAAWQPTEIDPAGALVAVDCPSRVRCVAVDDAGNMLVGVGRIAPVRAAPRPAVGGLAGVGRRLSTTTGGWSSDAPPAGYAYRWERCAARRCSAIRGAIRATYRVGRADLGRRLRVRVTAFDAVGSTDAYSRTTATVTGTGAQG